MGLAQLAVALELSLVGRRGDRQNLADRRDPVLVAVLIGEAGHGIHQRSRRASAKYALALRSISLACLSPRFSRSSAMMRSAASVVVPGRVARPRSG